MITLVNYGLGNIQAFVNIYRRLNIPVTTAETSRDLASAEKIILPGVGAFDWAMANLERSGMRACLDDLVMVQRRPVLGICVGMQMMARHSDEGELPGLGWIDGEVRRFDEGSLKQRTDLPHMGWNDVHSRDKSSLFEGLGASRFYFLHSYYFEPKNPDDVLAATEYSGSFASAVGSENILGTQFHPEKSHSQGIRLLQNFSEL